MNDDDPLSTESGRLAAVRKLYANGDTEKFANDIGFSYNRWNNFENDYPFPRNAAFLFHAKYPHISIDWIWWGDARGMTTSLLQELKEASKKP